MGISQIEDAPIATTAVESKAPQTTEEKLCGIY